MRARLIEAFHEQACLSTPCTHTCVHRAHVALRTAAPELAMAQRAADVHAELRMRNREYGKASRTIAALRGEAARLREDVAKAREATLWFSREREMLAILLGLPRTASGDEMRAKTILLAEYYHRERT